MKLKTILGMFAVFMLMFFASFCNAEIYEKEEQETEQVQKQTIESFTFITTDMSECADIISDAEHRKRSGIISYKNPAQISDQNEYWNSCQNRERKRYIYSNSENFTSNAMPYFFYHSTYGLANRCS